MFLASVHNVAGQVFGPQYYDDAIEVAKRGVEAEQFGPAIRIELSRAYAGKKDYPNAIEQARIAAEMDPSYVDAWLMTATLYEESGDKAAAAEFLKKYDPYRPGYERVVETIKRLEASATATPAP